MCTRARGVKGSSRARAKRQMREVAAARQFAAGCLASLDARFFFFPSSFFFFFFFFWRAVVAVMVFSVCGGACAFCMYTSCGLRGVVHGGSGYNNK